MTTASRRTFILLALGAAAAVALWLALSEPAASPAATPPAPAVAALPLNLPPAASAASAAGGAAAQAASATIVPPPAAKPPARRVGSEGYGPHIERAQAGNDVAAAWEAVQWMRGCASIEQRRTSYELARDHGAVPEMMTQLMQEVDAEARLCQTVTAQHRTLLPELASRAMRAGVPEAASVYAAAVSAGDLTPPQRQEVADAMRRDAQAGHPMSLLNAALANEAWGLSDAERLAFMYAYGEMNQPGAQATVMALAKQGSFRLKAPPTQAQMDAAKVDGQRILDRLKAAGKQP
ncbi:hypothetical protein ACS5PN_17850 [Roseateles sp. NT4]|uniref:hypothetical protein n=1 Tax=Roseateles sp. NT4 TaxID=3453715 RepID=UPI003EE830F8